eukprot:4921896-Amphidinium_carterae.1
MEGYMTVVGCSAHVEPDSILLQLLLNQDITPLEQLVVDLNGESLWEDQQFDINTLLMLRCLPESDALDLIGTFGQKARAMKGKGRHDVCLQPPPNERQGQGGKFGV